MTGSGEHPVVRRTPSAEYTPDGPSQLRDDWLPHVRTDGENPREKSNFLVPLMLTDQRHLPSQAYLDFPRSREWGAAVSRYGTLFTAFEIRPQDVLLRLPNRRLYSEPHVQEYLDSLDSDCEEDLMKWVLAVLNTSRTGTAQAQFPGTGLAPPEGEAPASESDPRLRGQMEPGYTVRRTTEEAGM